MEYRTLGTTGMTVSSLCMGTMTFGREADEQESTRMFNACREAGINFFDCANIYAGGESERILGRLVKESRDEVVITSKVGMGAGGADPHTRSGLSRRHIMRQMEGSLRRLGTDWIDIYFCHCEDSRTPLDETLRTMDDLVHQGKIRYVGLSNWPAWRVARALGAGERLGTTPIHVIEPMYSLAKRTAEIELLPMARAENLGVITYSPLGGGLLTGKYRGSADSAAGRLREHSLYAKRYADKVNFEIAERFSVYAERERVHPVTLAVAWVRAAPGVTAPILGARSLEQLQPALAAADFGMSSEQWSTISALTPSVSVATDRDEARMH
jgi:aryl-alcohol dehydrogenase-like predicted oxidoreductase